MKSFFLLLFCLLRFFCPAQDSLIQQKQWIDLHKKLLIGTWYSHYQEEELTFNPDGRGVSRSANSDQYCVEIAWRITFHKIEWWSLNPGQKLVCYPNPKDFNVALDQKCMEVVAKKHLIANPYRHTRKEVNIPNTK